MDIKVDDPLYVVANELPNLEQQLATAREIHNQANPTVPFQPCLARLLVLLNDPVVEHRVQVDAARLLLPYYHPLPDGTLPTTIKLPKLRNANAILKAQRLVVDAIATGRLEPNAGRALITSLALMVRTLDATIFEDRLEQIEANAASGRPVLQVINAIEADDDEASEP